MSKPQLTDEQKRAFEAAIKNFAGLIEAACFDDAYAVVDNFRAQLGGTLPLSQVPLMLVPYYLLSLGMRFADDAE